MSIIVQNVISKLVVSFFVYSLFYVLVSGADIISECLVDLEYTKFTEYPLLIDPFSMSGVSAQFLAILLGIWWGLSYSTKLSFGNLLIMFVSSLLLWLFYELIYIVSLKNTFLDGDREYTIGRTVFLWIAIGTVVALYSYSGLKLIKKIRACIRSMQKE
jgi:hypothetical protein